MILGVITLIAGVLLTTIPWLDYCILKVSIPPFNFISTHGVTRHDSGRAVDGHPLIKPPPTALPKHDDNDKSVAKAPPPPNCT